MKTIPLAKGGTMRTSIVSRPVKVGLFLVLALASAASLVTARGNRQQEEFEKMLKGKAPVRKGQVDSQVIKAPPIQPAYVPPVAPSGFTPQTRVGFTVGDHWEPAI